MGTGKLNNTNTHGHLDAFKFIELESIAFIKTLSSIDLVEMRRMNTINPTEHFT